MMFAGIIARDGHRDPRQWIAEKRLLSLIDPDGIADCSGTWRDGPTMLAQTHTYNTPQSRAARCPEECTATGRRLVGWVRIDNRKEVCSALSIPCNDSLSDGQLVLAAYRQWGKLCVEHLEGDFAFAIFDPNDGSVFCARDAMGARPFYYYLDDDVFAFSSGAAIFPWLRGIDTPPNDIWIGRYLLRYPFDPTQTALKGVLRLPPAHRLTIRPDGEAGLRQYFTFDGIEGDSWSDDAAAIDGYRTAFDQAVDDRLASDYPIGVESSGGLDSSTILGRASETLPSEDAIHCFTLVGQAEEPSLVLETALHLGIANNHVCTRRPDTMDSAFDKRIAALTGFPAEHFLAGSFSMFYHQCQELSIRTLLSGHGGDEGVTSHFGTKKRRTNVVRRARDWLRRNLAEPLAANGHARAAPLPSEVLHPDYIAEYSRELEILTPSVLGPASINDRIRDRLSQSHVAGRMESCALAAASFGISYRWPLLDRRLVTDFLRLPGALKDGRRGPRYVHRQANIGRIPDSILWHAKPMGELHPAFQAQLRPKTAPKLDNLHPQLASIVNLSKVFGKDNRPVHSSNGYLTPGRIDTLRFVQETDRRVVELSNWLNGLDDARVQRGG